MLRRWRETLWRRAAVTATGSVTRATIARRWIGLHAPHSRMEWMKKALTATTTIRDDPDPAERPVRQRALGRRELHHAEPERHHRRDSMKLDGRRRGPQRLESHGVASREF